MYRVSFTPLAEQDLTDSLRYISEVLKAPAAAHKLLDDFDAELARLETQPLSCPLVHDDYLAASGIRALCVGNYLAFYRVHEEEGRVVVLRFMYARRDWEGLLS
jgi:toxin ParE1/3/4